MVHSWGHLVDGEVGRKDARFLICGNRCGLAFKVCFCFFSPSLTFFTPWGLESQESCV